VTLDHWYTKNVMFPLDPSITGNDPDRDNALRRTLVACAAKGIGTVDDTEITAIVHDFDSSAGGVSGISVN
jgi:hypothetical protein